MFKCFSKVEIHSLFLETDKEYLQQHGHGAAFFHISV